LGIVDWEVGGMTADVDRMSSIANKKILLSYDI